jgi:hypothetical protein
VPTQRRPNLLCFPGLEYSGPSKIISAVHQVSAQMPLPPESLLCSLGWVQSCPQLSVSSVGLTVLMPPPHPFTLHTSNLLFFPPLALGDRPPGGQGHVGLAQDLAHRRAIAGGAGVFTSSWAVSDRFYLVLLLGGSQTTSLDIISCLERTPGPCLTQEGQGVGGGGRQGDRVRT